MIPLFIFICAIFGILLAKFVKNMNFTLIYILLTATGLILFLFGIYVFSAPSISAAIGSIAFTLVFMVTYLGGKKRNNK
ncbi:MAG: hypothetical protein COB24_06215 [Hyphomicrobiales bacterium]|nr:MAG: hypothetical protein COB24_06215 [Hyphomicrobiales bacterium]